MGVTDGVVGLTRVATAEYGPAGVRVNAVCPGVIDTEVIDRASEEMGEEGIGQIVQAKPLRRMWRSEEVASAAVWLCSGGRGSSRVIHSSSTGGT
ncbi:SDR family oxidoreductase [Halobaculum rubrum]|uniref:SDR family oxidoreductase n=1 Tax=Halobaculum rubrum TaxID=2872158 RepID=UPI001CA44567|nr:SDR family oxidoreductase [Halobaculum rubrum]QZX99197.1 SDR family oxidoreductase [Halobaculum rubrum]